MSCCSVLHPRIQCCCILEPGGDTGDSPVPLERLLHRIRTRGGSRAAGEQLVAPQPLPGRAPITRAMDKKPFHIVSPLPESLSLSRAGGTRVYMKLENIQPTGSFKIRGIGHLCQEVSVGTVWAVAGTR